MVPNLAATADQITIEYALTRGEVTRSYFQAIRQSPEYLRRVIMLAAILALLQMCSRALVFRHFGGAEILSAIVVFVVFLVMLPIALFLTAKTDTRALTISPDGISTSIGKKFKQIPWKAVKLVQEASTFILIAGRSGNAFFIPDRAFASPDDRGRFLERIGIWRAEKRNP